ncbi:MAG: DUF309 domain-containing protein [Planctomycetes bacterium]|nr:DUF309 domain-containing protein [Planctomycetota bacterium]
MDHIPLFNPDPIEISCSCQDVLLAGVVEGLRLFNSGEYFQAHEVLEDVWREERRPIRELYRGILQVAVAYYHLNRGNLIGARKNVSTLPGLAKGLSGHLPRDQPCPIPP